MTTPHLPTLTNSAPFEWFPMTQVEDWNQIIVPFSNGGMEIRARRSRPRRSWVLLARYITTLDLDTIMAFLRDRMRAGETWYVDSNHSNIWRPYDAPTLSQPNAGTLGARTHYVAVTFSDGTNTTLVSEESSLAINANKLLSVAVPVFPRYVTEAHIYIGTVSGAQTYVSKEDTSGGTWSEAETDVDGDSASGQKTLNVTATTGIVPGDWVVVNSGGAREEFCEVASLVAGTSLTMVSDLTYTHTAVQGDKVNHKEDEGGALPTSNTLQEEIEVALDMKRGPAPIRVAPGLYRLELRIVEAI